MATITTEQAMTTKKNTTKNVKTNIQSDTESSTLLKSGTKFRRKERTKVQYPEEGRKEIARLIEREIVKCSYQYYRDGDKLVTEAQKYKKSNSKKYHELNNKGQEMINLSMNFSPAAFQRYCEEYVFPDGQKYPLTHNQFYLLLRGAEQGYSMAVLLRLAFHLTKDADRTISYSYEELVAIASCNASRQYFDYSKNQLVDPEDEIKTEDGDDNNNNPDETLVGS